jgi:ribosomal protein S18 acetylase RimI-like enzyme
MIALWGSPIVLSRGRAHDASCLAALVCEAEGEMVGLATYDIREGDCELVTIDALTRGQGVGTKLLEAAIRAARQSNCRRLWLITSNDNLSALRFYQRRGLRLIAVHRGAIDEARRVKPEIPLTGHDGIAIHDELELEVQLDTDESEANGLRLED